MHHKPKDWICNKNNSKNCRSSDVGMKEAADERCSRAKTGLRAVKSTAVLRYAAPQAQKMQAVQA